ncbi:hypothetical protein NCAS_0B05930 [Naumovozyma castellii]|uniref:UDP-N-acetylglucosamine diphosphorylase n=1 Tax=Naumovozyma castellii TaxID=27288 RepID=G0V9R0_NAUCA|nr:hypothetical protein NCAS_0B05930 [Naumovozyma castellii CBS 4309]CCC68677.1 hypothetical protein NCAS_0B05930 [Naumovozyma castellii CBS 4309]
MTQDTKQLYIDAGQEHLFRHWDILTDDEKTTLLSNLAVVAERNPPAKLIESCQEAIRRATTAGSSSTIEPLPAASYQSIINAPLVESEYRQLGLDAIKNGEVAVILMAGGQGTRLGSALPKGCYNIDLPSQKSLFQIQAEKILRLQALTGSKFDIPWYVMTSAATSDSTREFFSKNLWFGLKHSQIKFFNQGTLPALDSTGRHMLLKNRVSLVESPDGNGGLYQAIKDNKLLEEFENRGIKHLYMYCVDNVLAKVADPILIGFAIKHGFQLATKAVRKTNPHEPVGLIAMKGGNKPCVIEYSEISNELAEAMDEQDDTLLRLRAGNIVNHYYSVELLREDLEKWCNEMPYHVAKKKIPYYDNTADKFIPVDSPNGIKLEQFIFDVFPDVPLEKFGCLEVDRSKEFAPLKNGPGSKTDNPETSKLAYLSLGTSWLENAGAKVLPGVLVEVSSRLSYEGENLSQFKGKVFNEKNIVLE